ncbi:winged helix-turn-helix domain-containing protein [Streptomyces sp. V2I9]|uniref:winged helix-turn-helix domain-containing protein n=1 Tax=Streptomyces sp. V2I9 TaxID=3042304 RepID=UPI00277DA0A7|nr:winged helix-turn-helix domain-containing protein [Streptomyces sp. V2I9]MDQ0987592.1 DNA-binding transcriptional ArsR family regulator [Streptomyces sp. V2I9]
MVRLHLTVEGLSRIRFVGSLGPDLESRFAELRYADARPDEFAEWRMKVRRRLRRPGALGVPGNGSQRELRVAPSVDALRFSSVAVVPFWGRIRNYLELEREARGRAVLTGGVERVLNNLHPAVSWSAPVLRVDNDQEEQGTDLLGDGLVIAPSLFAPAPMVVDAETGGQGAPVLVYNVSPPTDAAAGLWRQQEDDRAAALSELLGQTRANVLESLRSPVSISDISRQLDLSHPSVSRHLGVLRRSGLIAAERRNNLTLHRLTHLGEVVLGRQD